MSAAQSFDMPEGEMSFSTLHRNLTNPQDTEGFLSPEAAQQAAFMELEPYDVRVKSFRAFGNPIDTENGTIQRYSTRFTDGAVQLTSVGIPDARKVGADNVSPYAISYGDAYCTGPDGYNLERMKSWVDLGYPVISTHHQSRHSVLPTSVDRLKTIGSIFTGKGFRKTAHREHAALDHIDGSELFSPYEIIRKGYSRSKMSGHAFVATGPMHDRKTMWFDGKAPCFLERPGVDELFTEHLAQIPRELKAVGKLAVTLAHQGRMDEARELAKTFDLHPLNLLHEVVWFPHLISGEIGKYVRAMPLDTSGVVEVYSGDAWSKTNAWHNAHANRPNLLVLEKDGVHLEGANDEVHADEDGRLLNLMAYMHAHGMSLTGVRPADIVAPEDLDLRIA